MTSLLPFGLALIMASLGLSLVPADFARVFRRPRGVLLGLGNLLLLSPLLAFGVAEIYGLSPEFAVGLVLLGAAPGGATANLLTHLAKGDTALAVSITAISSLLAAISIPLYLSFGTSYFEADVIGTVDATGIALRVFAITVVPLLIGMHVRAKAEAWVLAHERTAKRVSLVTFVLIVLAVFAEHNDVITDNLGALAAATLTLNLAAMSCSFAIARGAGLGTRAATAVGIELGVHNTALAIAVALVIDTALTIPAAIYSTFMPLTAALFARMMHRRNLAEAAVV